MIRKMYRVFDELHATKEEAMKVLTGWEHKEKVTEVYAVGGKELENEYLNMDLHRVYIAKTMKEALEEEE